MIRNTVSYLTHPHNFLFVDMDIRNLSSVLLKSSNKKKVVNKRVISFIFRVLVCDSNHPKNMVNNNNLEAKRRKNCANKTVIIKNL